jgi:hypothetical protein
VAVAAAAVAVAVAAAVMFNTVTTADRITDVPNMPNHEQNFNLLWIMNLTQDLWL